MLEHAAMAMKAGELHVSATNGPLEEDGTLRCKQMVKLFIVQMAELDQAGRVAQQDDPNNTNASNDCPINVQPSHVN